MDSYLSSSNNNKLPLVTVAVITRNRADSLKRTLDAIKLLEYPNYEVLVVDNESTDDSKEVIINSGFYYLFSKKNNGFAKSRQIAVDAAKGEYICWCDDDCIPNSDWILCFISCFSKDSQLSILGGAVQNINFPKNLHFKGKSILGDNGNLIFIEDGNSAEFYGNLNLAMKIKDIRDIGGYDKIFKGGYEEIDLTFRIKIHGKKIGFCPFATVKHFHNDVSFKKGRIFFGGQFSRIYFFLKHRSKIKNFYWNVFLSKEILLFAQDLKISFRGLASGIKRRNSKKITVYVIEVLNSCLSRIIIPIIIFKTRN